MLENNAKIILNYINSNCLNGKFVVLTIEEILSAFPMHLNVQKETVKNAIASLFQSGFIRLKYDDGFSFCVSSTEKGLNYKDEFIKESTPTFNKLELLGWCVFCSFLGAFLGAVIAVFLSAIWRV